MSAQWPPPDAEPPRADGPPELPNPWTQNGPAQYPQNPAANPWMQNPGAQYAHNPSLSAGQPYPPAPPTDWTTAAPPRLSDRFEPQRPVRSGPAIALFGVLGMLVLGLVAVLALPVVTNLRLPEGPDGSWPNQSSSAPKPTGSATASMPTDPMAILKKNPIYAIKVPAKCPAQSIPSSKAAFRRQVKGLLDCANSAWRKALARTPVTFTKPRVTFYDKTATSPCGRLGTTYAAAYCSGDRTLYFSTASYTQGRYYRLAVAEFVMHEYAHHVQELAGIFASEDAMDEKSAVTTRRIELQAHCMAHYQLTHSGIGFTASDRANAEFQFDHATDPRGHGSTTAERYWGRRGLDGSKIGACNTWKVRSTQVK